jgi:hypothetical protein
MPTQTDDRRSPTEPVDLDDPQALHRAIAMHQAGKAVLTVPFNSTGPGTLTWLDPSDAQRDAGASHAEATSGSLK